MSFISSCIRTFHHCSPSSSPPSTALIQRATSESQCRGPHCTQRSNHHLTPRRWTHSLHQNLQLSFKKHHPLAPYKIQHSAKRRARQAWSATCTKTFHRNWLLSRPQKVTYTAKHHKWTHFKTPILCTKLDTFQDPYILHPNSDSLLTDPQQWTLSNITQVTHFKTLTQENNSVWISMGNYLQIDITAKSPWETTFSEQTSSNLSIQWNFGLNCENKEKDTSHANNQHLSRC